MDANFYQVPLVAVLAILFSFPLKAAQPFFLQTESFKTVKQQFLLSIPGVAKNSLISANSLNFIQQHTDKNWVTHIRMQQEYEGFEVFGGYAILHSKSSGAQLLQAPDVKMNGTLYLGLQQELGKPPENFINNSSQALQHFKAQFKGENISNEQIKPLIFIDSSNQSHWAYKVSILIEFLDKIPAKPTALIDAKTYNPFEQWDDIKTASAVKGRGYGGNFKTGSYIFGKELPLLAISRDNLFRNCYMENSEVKIVDMKYEKKSANNPMKFSCRNYVSPDKKTFMTGYSGDGYDKINGAFSPSNDAMYAGSVIKSMYQNWYDVEVLTKKGKPMQLVMRVHYGNNYENAFWDGIQMTYGDGAEFFYPLVSLGIGAHEVSHGFTEQHSNLLYKGRSGGINESFSDMSSKAAELYSTGKFNWEIGTEIMKEGSGLEALRYMDRPSRDGVSIDSADKYDDELDVHHSSGVFNRLFYLMATTKGWGVRKVFAVMVKANMDYWIPTTNFEDAGCGVINAAQDLKFPIKDVQAALSKVAVNFNSCPPQGFNG
ncbi:MAG: peptidase M4 family protein [Tatlockia sp.]|nr:peptidase M4 family protein [Tatlockia sp.]